MNRLAAALLAATALRPAASVKVEGYPGYARQMKEDSEREADADVGEMMEQSMDAPTGPALLTQERVDAAEAYSHLWAPLRERIKAQTKILGHAPVVYFHGDSTVRNQWMAYCSLLNPDRAPPQPVDCVNDFCRKKDKLYKDSICNSTEGLGSAALFYTWGTWQANIPLWARSRGMPDADIIVYAIGHHIMHRVSGSPWGKINAREFVNYEMAYTHFASKLKELMPTATRILQTDGSICENRFFGDWVVTDPAKSAAPCVTELVNQGMDNENANNVCVESLLTRAGLVKLNTRLLAANEKVGGIAVADIFKVEDGHCGKTAAGVDMTEDGVHFHVLSFNMLAEVFRAAGW